MASEPIEGSNLNVSGFSPGGPVPVGYSFLERASGTSLRTPTRKGQEQRRSEACNAGKLTANASLGHFDSRAKGRAASRIAAVLSAPSITQWSVKDKSPRIRTVQGLPNPQNSDFDVQLAATATHDLRALNRSLTTLAALPLDPFAWSPAHVAVYLAHILRLVPLPVVEDLSNFVRDERMSGNAFLRLRERDLADKGMNMRWRRLMSEASRRLRRDALRRRIWSGTSDDSKKLSDEDDVDFIGHTDAEKFIPSQRHLMTATLKRIRDRRFVQGLVQAIESPKQAYNTEFSNPELPEGRSATPFTHSKHNSGEKARILVNPPFGEGYVRRQAYSFSNLADVAKDQDSHSYASTWRRHRRGTYCGEENSVSSLDTIESTSLSMTSSPSSSSISSPATDYDIHDFASSRKDLKNLMLSNSVDSSWSLHELDSSADVVETWDTPLDQSLVDAILSSNSDQSSTFDEESDVEPPSPSSISGIFRDIADRAVTSKADRYFGEEKESSDNYDEPSRTVRGPDAAHVKTAQYLFAVEPAQSERPEIQQLELELEKSSGSSVISRSVAAAAESTQHFTLHDDSFEDEVGTVRPSETAEATEDCNAEPDRSLATLLQAFNDSVAQHQLTCVSTKVDSSIIDHTAKVGSATEDRDPEVAELSEAKDANQRTLSRATTRLRFSGVLHTLNIARSGALLDDLVSASETRANIDGSPILADATQQLSIDATTQQMPTDAAGEIAEPSRNCDEAVSPRPDCDEPSYAMPSWLSSPVDIQFEALAKRDVCTRSRYGRKSVAWILSAFRDLRDAISDPIIGMLGATQSSETEGDADSSAAGQSEPAGEDGIETPRKGVLGLRGSWLHFPPYMLGFGAGVAVVIVSELLLRRGPRCWR